MIQGYYGCDCHPFKTIEEYKSHLNQKIEILIKIFVKFNHFLPKSFFY